MRNPNENAFLFTAKTLADATYRKIARSLTAHAGSIGVLLVATALTILAVQWVGFDFKFFSRAFIGDSFDTLFDSWTIYQAMDNLLHRPGNLGYAPIYYDDRAAFAYTVAPYGIAIPLLPVFLLTAENLELTYNLYLIATFALTAWAAYLLVRYLLRSPHAVSIIAGLMVAFSQYRFLHLTHPAELSMQFYLLTLYCLHRLIDTPRVNWAVDLGVLFLLTLLTSGYLGMMALTTAAIILAYAGLARRQHVSRQLISHLGVAAALVVALGLPFAVPRFDNATFSAGHTLAEVVEHSATPAGWLTSIALIYINISPHKGEGTLFLGFVPIVLSLIAWWRRKDEATRPLEDGARVFSAHQIVVLYSIIILTGYLFTLGPVLIINDTPVAPLPYLILMQLPGFSALRAVSRFIVLPITGTALLSAYTLTLLSKRAGRFTYVWMLSLIALLLAIESIPPNGSITNRIADAWTLDSDQRLYPARVRDKDVPVYRWLAEQPPGTPVLHYPVELSPEVGGDVWNTSATFQYVADIRLHNQPMLNGHASLPPDWYYRAEWGSFPTISHISILEARGIRYILIHHELMGQEESAAFAARLSDYEAEWGRLPFVGRFGDVDVYRVRMPRMDAYFTAFDRPVPGSGWYTPETQQDGTSFQWTSEEAWLALPLVTEGDVRVEFHVLMGILPDSVDSLSLSVDGETIPLRARSDGAGGRRFEGVVPHSAIAGDPNLTRFVWRVGSTTSPLALGYNDDTRRLGVAFDWLRIEPAPSE